MKYKFILRFLLSAHDNHFISGAAQRLGKIRSALSVSDDINFFVTTKLNNINWKQNIFRNFPGKKPYCSLNK